MNVTIVPPGIKSIAQHLLFKDGTNTLILTNPLFQRDIEAKAKSFADVVYSDSLLHPEEDEPINIEAKKIARNWFLNSNFQEALDYRGVNLGGLLTHSLTYYFVGLLKSLATYENVLKKYDVKKLIISEDGSYWGRVVRVLAKVRNIPLEALPNYQARATKLNARHVAKYHLKSVFQKINQLRQNKMATGKPLFSCSLRFALPFFRRGSEGYYLRDIFSLKASLLSLKHRFYHFTSDDFSNKGLTNDQYNNLVFEYWHKLKDIVDEEDTFQIHNYSLWEVIEDDLYVLVNNEFPKFLNWVDSFYQIFETVHPSSILVDEDVTPFNKALVQTAHLFGIRTYSMVHGVPFFDVGTLPNSAETILVWGASSKKRLLDWEIEEEKIIEVGAPQYAEWNKDRFRNSRKKIIKDFSVPVNNKVIFLATQPFHTNERPDFLGSYLTPQFIEKSLLCMNKILGTYTNTQVIIKLHPGEKNSWFTYQTINAFEKTIQNRIRIIQNYETPILISGSDVVLTFGSTLYYECLLLAKKVFIFDEPEKRHFKFMSPDFLNLDDHSEASKTIYEALSNPEPKGDSNLLEEHFHQMNQDSIQNILKLLKLEHSNRPDQPSPIA